MRRLLSLLGLSALSLLPASASGYVPTGSKWSQLPVTYKVNQSTIPPSIQATAVQSIDAGFASWSGPSCTSFQAVNQGNTSSSYSSQDGQNVILWRSDSWPLQLGSVNSTIGITLTAYSGNESFDSDIVFNNVGFDWSNTGQNNTVDTQSIAVHEEGHFLGLDHTPPQNAIMYAAYSGGIKRTLSGDDSQGVCALYPCDTGDCGSAGSSGSSGSSGSGGGTGLSCGACQEQVQQPGAACSGALQACATSQSCVNFYNCLQGCSTQSCVNSCVSKNPQGVQLYNDVIGCICETGCPTECAEDCSAGSGGSGGSSGSSSGGSSGSGATSGTGATGGGGNAGSGNAGSGTAGSDSGAAGKCGLSTGNATCDGCFDAQCCALGSSCAASEDCVGLLECVPKCNGNQQCADKCGTQFPSGIDNYNGLIQCFTSSCGGPCGLDDGGGAGAAGAGAAAGTTGSAGVSPGGGQAGAASGAAPAASSDGGCGCHAAPAAPTAGLWAVALGLAAVARRRRR